MDRIFQKARFIRPSDVIDLKKLERESRKLLYIGLVIGVFLHIMAGLFISYKKAEIAKIEKKEVKLIIVDIIELPPRIRNPYEDWKRINTKRTYTRKKFRFRIPGGKSTFKSPEMVIEMPRDMDILDTEKLKQHALDTQADILDRLLSKLEPVFQDVESEYKFRDLTITREPEDRLSLREEMITLEDIDELGLYKGFVVQDMSDKQNITGFVHIPKYLSGPWLGNIKEDYNLHSAIIGLSEAVNFYTGMNLKVDDPVSLGSPEFINYPLIYITSINMRAFELNPFGTKKLGEYLRDGGFAIIDNGRPWKDYTPTEASLLNVLLKALGKDFSLKPIPQAHPLYHCFFDFDGLPPEGAEKWSPPVEKDIPDWGRMLHIPELEKTRLNVSKNPYVIWGVWIGDRLAAVYSDKGYGHFWHRGVFANKSRDFASTSKEKYNFNPQLKMGVNMMVFALIQRGGIAKRYVNYETP